MPSARQWEAAVARHRRRRQSALACCDECLHRNADPEDEELWALLPGEPVGQPLVDVLAEEARRDS